MTKLATTMMIIVIFLALCLGLAMSQDEPVIVSDVVHFALTAGHQDNNLFTDFDGYVTCNREAGCPQTDILAITINNSHPEMDTRSKFVMIDVYLEDGTIFSQAPLNQTVFIGVTSKLPMKVKRALNKGETIYFSGQLEWHGVSETGTTTIEFGYGVDYATAVKKTYNQPFYADVKQNDDVFASLESKTNIAPWPYEFVLYAQTPNYLTSKFTFRPFGGIYNNGAKCSVDNLPMTLTVVHNDDDVLQKFPEYILTIPQNQIQQYQTFKANTQVQITCSGFMHNTGSINRGFTILFHGPKDAIGVATIHRFQKALSQQTEAMARADSTVNLSVHDYYHYTMKGVDSHDNQKYFSYHTIHVELNSLNLNFPSNKTMHLFLDGIGGGAISLSRWSLTLRDSQGRDLPYTTTDKLKVAWYADGKVARFDTWVISLTDKLREHYDPTKGARLTISYVLSFDVISIAPPILSPTTMIGIEQDVHWVNYATKSSMTFYQFITPVLSKKAMVATENFQFNAFHYEDHHEDHKDDEEKKEKFISQMMSNDPNDVDYIGTPILFGFNVTIANVQYLDFERPSLFSLSIPTREFNFAGDYSDCTLNEHPIGILDPFDTTKVLTVVNHQTLVFNQTLQPSVNYSLLCPHAFLTNSSSSSSDRHKDKDIMVQFIANSNSPETNFYNMVACSFVSFGHNEHNTGVVFATITVVTLTLLFVAILIYIFIDRYRKNQQKEANATRDEVHADGDSPRGQESHQEQPGQYQQFNDH